MYANMNNITRSMGIFESLFDRNQQDQALPNHYEEMKFVRLCDVLYISSFPTNLLSSSDIICTLKYMAFFLPFPVPCRTFRFVRGLVWGMRMIAKAMS